MKCKNELRNCRANCSLGKWRKNSCRSRLDWRSCVRRKPCCTNKYNGNILQIAESEAEIGRRKSIVRELEGTIEDLRNENKKYLEIRALMTKLATEK